MLLARLSGEGRGHKRGCVVRTMSDLRDASIARWLTADFREQLGAIKVPTLIVCGTADAVTTPEHGRFMQQHIAGAQLVELHAAHLSNVEAGEAFTQAVVDFLQQ